MNKHMLKRITAVVLTVLLLALMTASYLFLAENASHDCIGEDCEICFEMHECVIFLSGTALALCSAGIILSSRVLISESCIYVRILKAALSPVALKVRKTE